jgi:uncharacterized membrane protein SpoIIM required for sporulation
MSVSEETFARWQQTEELLDTIESAGIRNSRPDDLIKLSNLYLELVSDLNRLKKASVDYAVRRRANKLALRTYGIIYQKKTMGITDFLQFFLFRFPELVRQRFHFIFAAAMILAMSSLIGFLCIHEKSRLLDLVIAPEEQQQLKSAIASIDPARAHALAHEPGFGLSSRIMVNNIRVSILAFALGFFFGIGTLVILVINGLKIGGLASLYANAGLSGYFWSLILPHGGIELMCIFITAGAGLIIGYALINPGSYRRREWLIKEGNVAIRLLLGSVPLLVLAGLIEAYITPAHLTVYFKLALSAVLFALLMLYLCLSGKGVQSWLRNLTLR